MRALGFNDQLEVVDAAAPAAAAVAAAAPDPKAVAAPPAGLDAAGGAGQAPSVEALAVAVSGGEAGTRSRGLGKGSGISTRGPVLRPGLRLGPVIGPGLWQCPFRAVKQAPDENVPSLL